MLNKPLPETWKLTIAKNIENKLFSKVIRASLRLSDTHQILGVPGLILVFGLH
jgi:hypothetical protein